MDYPHITSMPVAGDARPFWSVMIPTYNAPARYLEETLRTVLAQDPGPEQMQIEVVDDCSPDGPPVDLVHRIAGDRVTVHREPKNNGLAGIWNRCIEHARGEWVHILHQDDLVLPGFYSALRRGVESDPKIGAAFVRHASINPEGHWVALSEILRETPGILENWHEQITVRQQIQCPAIVVRRAAYEKVGGYLPTFCYTLDWEMWQRLAANFSVWFEPGMLACYRLHPFSATSRLRQEAADTRDIRAMIELTKNYHPAGRGEELARQAKRYYALLALQNSRQLLVEGQTEAARKQAAAALELSSDWVVFSQAAGLQWLRLRLAASRWKRKLKT